MSMSNCGQACPYNTLNGCKVKEYNDSCPLTNTAVPSTEYRMTNADRIRAMTDEELETFLINVDLGKEGSPFITEWGKWLKQPAEGCIYE